MLNCFSYSHFVNVFDFVVEWIVIIIICNILNEGYVFLMAELRKIFMQSLFVELQNLIIIHFPSWKANHLFTWNKTLCPCNYKNACHTLISACDVSREQNQVWKAMLELSSHLETYVCNWINAHVE